MALCLKRLHLHTPRYELSALLENAVACQDAHGSVSVGGFPQGWAGWVPEQLFRVFGRYLLAVSRSIILASGEVL